MKCVGCGKVIPASKWKVRCYDCWEKQNPKKSQKKNHKTAKPQTERDNYYYKLQTLAGDDIVYTRYSPDIPGITKNSYESYDRVILDCVDTMGIGFELKKEGLLPDEIDDDDELDEYDWEQYAVKLKKKADKGDKDAQDDFLRAFLSLHSLWDRYSVSKQYLSSKGKEVIGIKATGVNVTIGGSTEGVPYTSKYEAFLTGNIKGMNIENDGLILEINEIIAIYNHHQRTFAKINKTFINREYDKLLK